MTSDAPFIFLGGSLIGAVMYFAALGLASVICRLLARVLRRHARIAVGLATEFSGKVLREPATGRVGLCVSATVRGDTPYKRWVRPERVALLTDDRQTARTFLCACMGCRMIRPMVTMIGLQDGRIRVVPLRQCAPAPATEAAAFLASIPTEEEEA